jgi:hypothetical protein
MKPEHCVAYTTEFQLHVLEPQLKHMLATVVPYRLGVEPLYQPGAWVPHLFWATDVVGM